MKHSFEYVVTFPTVRMDPVSGELRFFKNDTFRIPPDCVDNLTEIVRECLHFQRQILIKHNGTIILRIKSAIMPMTDDMELHGIPADLLDYELDQKTDTNPHYTYNLYEYRREQNRFKWFHHEKSMLK